MFLVCFYIFIFKALLCSQGCSITFVTHGCFLFLGRRRTFLAVDSISTMFPWRYLHHTSPGLEFFSNSDLENLQRLGVAASSKLKRILGGEDVCEVLRFSASASGSLGQGPGRYFSAGGRLRLVHAEFEASMLLKQSIWLERCGLPWWDVKCLWFHQGQIFIHCFYPLGMGRPWRSSHRVQRGFLFSVLPS